VPFNAGKGKRIASYSLPVPVGKTAIDRSYLESNPVDESGYCGLHIDLIGLK
jgi:hypothetical protein